MSSSTTLPRTAGALLAGWLPAGAALIISDGAVGLGAYALAAATTLCGSAYVLLSHSLPDAPPRRARRTREVSAAPPPRPSTTSR